jgi:hypothetical protein
MFCNLSVVVMSGDDGDVWMVPGGIERATVFE